MRPWNELYRFDGDASSYITAGDDDKHRGGAHWRLYDGHIQYFRQQPVHARTGFSRRHAVSRRPDPSTAVPNRQSCTTALIFGFTSSRRARCALVTSPADSSFEGTAEAISRAVISQMWLITPYLSFAERLPRRVSTTSVENRRSRGTISACRFETLCKRE